MDQLADDTVVAVCRGQERHTFAKKVPNAKRSWTRKSALVMVTRRLRHLKLQMVTGEQSPMQIKRDSWRFQAKERRAAQTPEPPTDAALHDPRTLTRLVPILRGKSRQTTCSYVQWLRAERCHASRSRQRAVISFLFSKQRGCEDLTRELLRHFESYGFLRPVIVQCDTEMSIIDVCRKLARERKARTVVRFAPKTSHQNNGFVEAVHGHIHKLARFYQHQSKRTLAYSFQHLLPSHLRD